MNLAPGAATGVQSLAPSNGSLSYAAGGPGSTTGGTKLWTLSYTNDTGGSVIVEATAGMRGKGTGAGGTAFITHVMSASLSDGAGGESANPTCDGGSAFTAFSWSKSRTLAAGDTVTFSVGITATVGFSGGTWSAGDVQWEAVSMRLTAIKR